MRAGAARCLPRSDDLIPRGSKPECPATGRGVRDPAGHRTSTPLGSQGPVDTFPTFRSSNRSRRDQLHEGDRRLAHLLHRHASAVVQVLVLTSLGRLGGCTPGHRVHDRIGHTLLPGEVMEAVPDAMHGHRAIDSGQHLHLSPDVVELVVADRPGTGLAGEHEPGAR